MIIGEENEDMTREEAIRRIKIVIKCMECDETALCYDSYLHPVCELYVDKERLSLSDALNMAIQALEQEK